MPDLATILIPLDGSSFAESALPLGINLARRVNASIHLVRVHTPSPLWESAPEIVVLNPEREQETCLREEEYLKRVAGRIRADGLTVSTRLLKGEIVPAVRSYAESQEIGLIVMTSHGWGGIRRAILGSVADHMVRTVGIPVLIVTPGMPPRVNPASPLRILVPLDGSQLASSVIDQIKALDPAGASELFLTTVIQTVPPTQASWVFPPEVMLASIDQRERQSRAYLEKLTCDLRREGLYVHPRIRVGNKVAREILKVAEWERCDLVAIATHGAGGLDRVMFGSVADQVVRHSHVPVLVLRPINWSGSNSAAASEETAKAGVA